MIGHGELEVFDDERALERAREIIGLGVRLEQERIAWPSSLAALKATPEHVDR